MVSALRVLLVEDEQGEAERLVQALRRGGVAPTYRRVRTAAGYLSALQRGTDVILAAYRCRRFGAVQALDLLHQRGLDIPLIVVARTAGASGAIACLTRCASAYVRRDRLGLLAPAVARAVELKRLRDAKRQADAALQARTAELTQALGALETQAAQLRALSAALTVAEQRERRRLAETVRDGLQQTLFAARLWMVDVAREAPPAAREAAGAVTGLLDEAMAAARTLTAELGPPLLGASGLRPALEWLARWMATTHGLAVAVEGEGAALATLDERTQVLLFQAVRELLANVAAHAHTPTARITLAQTGDTLRLQVADAGVGFTPGPLRASAESSAGFGLFGVQQRLELLGGRLEVDSAPGQGSRLTLVVPCPPRAAAPPAPCPPRRVLLVHARTLERQILARVLRTEPALTLVGEAADSAAALPLAQALQPEVISVDLALPDAVALTRRLTAACPGARVLGLALFGESDHVAAMQAAGAERCLLNCGPTETLLAALRTPLAPGEPAQN